MNTVRHQAPRAERGARPSGAPTQWSCPGSIYGTHVPGVLNPTRCGACDMSIKVTTEMADDIVMSSPRRRESPEDIAAARELLGSVETNVIMDGLPGADRCPHTLALSGTNVNEMPGFILSSAPYRHHDYVQGMILRPNGVPYCKCGNNPSDAIHARCDWDEETGE